ncbi:MAG: RnfABCDGE type electron transport complex subunit B [Agathobaculum sp.]|nr:RnfABCDGE type electron transport complex subunit B [Agathobaculum sp.]MDY3619233.1 RnfABCDGE type electron transport complex subunit B [Agathobaculum sp.]
MDMQNVLAAVAVLFVMGVVFAVLLGIAAKVFAVEVDERVPLVRECLPGANCGGCGYPGCDGLAAAIVEGTAPVNGCPVGGAACAAKVAEVMGVEADTSERKIAHVYCNGGCNAVDKTKYEGLQDCTAAMRVANGPKACSFGCMGLGSCVKACAFDAIHIVDGVAKVDEEKCVACGKCVAACPKKLINLVPESKKVHVNCMNRDKGPEVMKVCSVGCIACKMCEKTCKFDAIHVENGVAKIDYDKCKNCKMCAKVCPKSCIEPVPTAEEKAKFAAAQKAQAEKAKEAAAAKAAAEAAAKTEEQPQA